ncbi:MAG: chorismate mutase / prephenate dehydratase, partial [Abditibacteriota bacterium]|nr:chorismate mutase / prephenate dehydratase [Abditibacteriota bacterium]
MAAQLAAALSEERAEIDWIDEEILRLLSQRVQAALRVGEKKKTLGLPFHDPSRERLIYERLRAKNSSLGSALPDVAVHAIYREIISACRNAEHPTAVAFLGPSGTNTQEAAAQHFGSAFTPIPCGTPDEVCAAVARGARSITANGNVSGADYGVIAIENSIQGLVSPNLDLLANSPLTICAEIELLIHHCLLSNTELGRITTVYSHEQGLAQCRQWLSAHLPGAALVPVTSTARGAEMATHEPGAAAISSALAANIYGLQVVASNIEDLAGNKTRFFVIGDAAKAPKASGRDKTSLTFLTPHKPGALVEVLGDFHRHNSNIAMSQSRPKRQHAWEYRIFDYVQEQRDD